nr:MAG TPA: LysM [Caudoviricetes sp.]
MAFTMRTSLPEYGNKFYNNGDGGGYSWCISGYPTCAGRNVLANCVGYVCGRFNEIIGSMQYKTLNCNAENFIERAKEAGLSVGMTPKVGAIMVWQRGATLSGNDGAGHVAIVEAVYDNNHVYTSESNYGGIAFCNAHRYNNNGNWGLGGSYSFRGFIYNPAVKDEVAPAPTPSDKFNIGDKVVINGALYTSSNASVAAGNTDNKITTITRKVPGAAHPYNTTGDLGWMDEASITKYEEPTSQKFAIGQQVIVNGALYVSSNAESAASSVSNRVTTITRFAAGSAHPYNTVGDLGWMDESSIQEYSGEKYTVQEGDTLSGIAARYGMSWQTLYAQNKFVIGNNPDIIIPGQVLTIR